MNLFTLAGLIMCLCTQVCRTDPFQPRLMVKNELLEIPNSTDIQILAEALYLNRHDLVRYVKDFPSKKRKGTDVCEMPKDKAMELCLRLERVYNHSEVGNYTLVANRQVEECRRYPIVFFHTRANSTNSVDSQLVRARKCPFQPDELYITSGNKRIPAYVLTWIPNQKKYLCLDHYLDDLNEWY